MDKNTLMLVLKYLLVTLLVFCILKYLPNQNMCLTDIIFTTVIIVLFYIIAETMWKLYHPSESFSNCKSYCNSRIENMTDMPASDSTNPQNTATPATPATQATQATMGVSEPVQSEMQSQSSQGESSDMSQQGETKDRQQNQLDKFKDWMLNIQNSIQDLSNKLNTQGSNLDSNNIKQQVGNMMNSMQSQSADSESVSQSDQSTQLETQSDSQSEMLPEPKPKTKSDESKAKSKNESVMDDYCRSKVKVDRSGSRDEIGVINNEMSYTDYHHIPLADTYDNDSFEYGYSFLPPEKWYPQPPFPPMCVSDKKCSVMPAYTNGAPLDVKEWNESRRITQPDNINTKYIKEKLNSGR